jgi:hypothetical protein
MVRVSKHVRKNESPDGGVVLDIQHGRMFGLNMVGSKILELVDQQCEPTLIAREIAEKFGVSNEVADRDVREFLAMLEKYHLIEVHASRASL